MKATTTNPALVMILVDGSHSTGASWVIDDKTGQESTVSRSIQDGVNRALHDLIINVCYADGVILGRINLGVVVAQGDEVRWGLDCEEPEDGWLDVASWANLAPQPANANEIPQWLSIQPEGKTPLIEGWESCFSTIEKYRQQYPESSVLLMTLTDGLFSELDLTEEIQDDLSKQQASCVGDASYLHLIGHISPDGKPSTLFPEGLPEGEYEQLLFELSTVLPSHLLDNGATEFCGVPISKRSRAYVHNADHGLLSELIQLGSRVVDGNAVVLTPTKGETEEE